MASNEYLISAGLVPIDNSSGAASNSYYIAAGLVPTDTAVAPTTIYNERGTWRGHMRGEWRGFMKVNQI